MAYTETLADLGIAISVAEESGHADRLMRTIKEEEVDLVEYEDLSDARR